MVQIKALLVLSSMNSWTSDTHGDMTMVIKCTWYHLITDYYWTLTRPFIYRTNVSFSVYNRFVSFNQLIYARAFLFCLNWLTIFFFSVHWQRDQVFVWVLCARCSIKRRRKKIYNARSNYTRIVYFQAVRIKVTSKYFTGAKCEHISAALLLN